MFNTFKLIALLFLRLKCRFSLQLHSPCLDFVRRGASLLLSSVRIWVQLVSYESTFNLWRFRSLQSKEVVLTQLLTTSMNSTVRPPRRNKFPTFPTRTRIAPSLSWFFWMPLSFTACNGASLKRCKLSQNAAVKRFLPKVKWEQMLWIAVIRISRNRMQHVGGVAITQTTWEYHMLAMSITWWRFHVFLHQFIPRLRYNVAPRSWLSFIHEAYRLMKHLKCSFPRHCWVHSGREPAILWGFYFRKHRLYFLYCLEGCN